MRSSSSLRAESMITGALEKARRLRTASKPSISGIMMSMMIMS